MTKDTSPASQGIITLSVCDISISAGKNQGKMTNYEHGQTKILPLVMTQDLVDFCPVSFLIHYEGRR